MRISLTLLVILSAIVISSTGVRSQTLQDSIVFQPDAEREFVDAMKSFKLGQYDVASASFSRILRSIREVIGQPVRSSWVRKHGMS